MIPLTSRQMKKSVARKLIRVKKKKHSKGRSKIFRQEAMNIVVKKIRNSFIKTLK